ncbi:hypothetical protein TSST111916_04820 [Tsukamurella strandjordii]|uniref:hypothetical protein n=1 Tax=Tsukamurella TaxID=2060 RepID=UPI001C7CBED6|nr:hypothetical protein [Tsukamurella sp. TY48]GIZ97361.1 hypothetical protein TTY48_19730 [Tsukamurella sp. TY48]
MTEWVEVLKVLVDGPRLPVRGVVRTLHADLIDRTETFGFIGAPPMPVVLGDHDVRVWRDGRRVRVERPDGSPYFITDGVTAWEFSDDPDESPTHAPADRVYYSGPGSELLISRSAQDWLHGDDFTRPNGPIGETTFLDRSCWAVELAPPEHKPYPLQIVVDRESGAILQERNDDAGFSVEYIELSIGEPVDGAVFTWTGPSTSLDERWAARRAEYEAAEQARLAESRTWFTDHVAAPALTVEVALGFSFSHFYDLDPADGSFSARVQADRAGGPDGVLSRRARSTQEWDFGRVGYPVRRWSTSDFDWACWMSQDFLDDNALGQLQRHLHPDESAVDQFTVEPDHT